MFFVFFLCFFFFVFFFFVFESSGPAHASKTSYIRVWEAKAGEVGVLFWEFHVCN